MTEESNEKVEVVSGPRSQMWKHEAMVEWINSTHEVDLDQMSAAEVIAFAFAYRVAWRHSDTYQTLVSERAEVVAQERAEREAAKAEAKAAKQAEREAARAEKEAAKAAAKAAAEAETEEGAKPAKATKATTAKKVTRKATKATPEADPFA